MNPYTALLSDIRDFTAKLREPKRVVSTEITQEEIEPTCYNMKWLHERVTTASQLGYDTAVVVKNGGLVFVFVERVDKPTIPWRWTKR